MRSIPLDHLLWCWWYNGTAKRLRAERRSEKVARTLELAISRGGERRCSASAPRAAVVWSWSGPPICRSVSCRNQPVIGEDVYPTFVAIRLGGKRAKGGGLIAGGAAILLRRRGQNSAIQVGKNASHVCGHACRIRHWHHACVKRLLYSRSR